MTAHRLRSVRPGNDCRTGLYRIQQLRSGEEDHAGAGCGEHPPAGAWILSEIILAALDRAKSDRIDHDPRLEARFDLEEPADFLQHRHRYR
jgi:hypothetical protein